MTSREMTLSFAEAKHKLEAYCAYQERCKSEIVQKIRAWNLSGEEEEKLLQYLEENNFFNEQRFAEAFVSGKFRLKGWGRNKIKAHLRLKQVSDAMIKKAFEELEDEAYFERMTTFAQKKKSELANKQLSDWQRKAKIHAYLLSKGYEADLVSEVLTVVMKIDRGC